MTRKEALDKLTKARDLIFEVYNGAETADEVFDGQIDGLYSSVTDAVHLIEACEQELLRMRM